MKLSGPALQKILGFTIALLISCRLSAEPIMQPLSVISGWNLLGNGVASTLDVASVFGDSSKINSVWKWNASARRWAFYSPQVAAQGNLASYASANGYDVLATVAAGEGYWVNAQTAVTFANRSGEPHGLNALGFVSGWNLVSSGRDLGAAALNRSLSGRTSGAPENATSIWAWDTVNSKWIFYAPSLDRLGGNALRDYAAANGYLDFGTGITLGGGRGFWLNYPGVLDNPVVDFGAISGLPMLDRGAGAYSAYVWETNLQDIPIGPIDFTISRVGDQGRITSGSVISITTNEPNANIPIAGDLTDYFAAGFAASPTGSGWRLWFIDVANQSAGSLISYISPSGEITGNYDNRDGTMAFTNNPVDRYGPTLPPEFAAITGTYRADGFETPLPFAGMIGVQGPFEFAVAANGSVSYTDPASCAVITIPWDGNGEYLRFFDQNYVLQLSDGVHRIFLTYDISKNPRLWQFRLGSSGSTDMYRTTSFTPGEPGALAGDYGLSLCRARQQPDTTPPIVTAPPSITVAAINASGTPSNHVTVGMSGPATAIDIVLAPWFDVVSVITSDAPAIFPIGTTTVTYTAQDKAGNIGTATRTVTVTDQTAPVITVPAFAVIPAASAAALPISDAQVQALLNSVTATDNVDGPLVVTNNLGATLTGLGFGSVSFTDVIFSATDRAGNTSTANARIEVRDMTAPVITVNPPNPATVIQGSTYSDAGAAGLDNVDGTVVVGVSNPVDSAVVGTYTVTYTARDRLDNTSTATRTVKVITPPEFGWTASNPIPSLQTHRDVVWANNQFLMIGEGSSVLTSVDGVSWQVRRTGSDAKIVKVLWTGSRYVAAAYFDSGAVRGRVLTSPDGITWTAISVGNFVGNIPTAMAYNGSTLVLFDIAGDVYTSADDGNTWVVRARVGNGFNGVSDVIWADNRFVAIARDSFAITYTSTTGTTWIGTGHPTLTAIPRSLLWDGTRFIAAGALGASGAALFTSTDLASWTSVFNGTSLPRLNKVARHGSLYVAVGGTSSGLILTSPDGLSWTSQTVPSGTSGLNTFASNGSVAVAAGVTGSLASSGDGLTWTSRKTVQTSETLNGVASNGSVHVAVSETGKILTSSDAVTWTTNPTVAAGFLGQVIFGGGQFLAVSGPTALTSPDGSTWTTRTTGVGGGLYDVVWNGNQYVAVGTSGLIRTSLNGTTWTTRTSGSTDDLQAVIWDGSRFLAVGSRFGDLLISSDGVAWTKSKVAPASNQGAAQFSYSLAFGGGIYVAGGANGNVSTSRNGTDWTQAGTLAGGILNDIVWDGRKFIGVTSNGLSPGVGRVLISTDGSNWIDKGVIDAAQNAIDWNGEIAIAVGAAGNIIVITP